MIIIRTTARAIFLFLFLGCYLIGSLAVLLDNLEYYHNYIFLAGSIFLLFYFATFCFSYFSIKRRRRVNGYS